MGIMTFIVCHILQKVMCSNGFDYVFLSDRTTLYWSIFFLQLLRLPGKLDSSLQAVFSLFFLTSSNTLEFILHMLHCTFLEVSSILLLV